MDRPAGGGLACRRKLCATIRSSERLELADEVAVLIYRTTRGFPTFFRCLGCGLLALVAFGAAGGDQGSERLDSVNV